MPVAAPRNAGPLATSCELADVFEHYGAAYQSTHRLSPAQRKALRDITRCRTAALGGHREWCDGCGFQRYVYHSCRNRHCPKCQTMAKEAWVAARQDELLPVPYFHNVFTLPHELNGLILFSERNQRALWKLLFDATAQTLLEFGRGNLGGKVGFTLVLHTWDQQLRPHFHLHCLIASGALSADGAQWIAGGAQFLFPVKALSPVFRAKYLDGLERLLGEGALDVPPSREKLDDPAGRRSWLRNLRRKPWVVYSKAPFAGPRKLLDYLGRYTHRAAISNHRLRSCEGGQVTFTYRDRRDGDRRKTLALPAEEFIARFLKHILPDRFMRIRHYGLLANRAKQKCLVRCRELLGVDRVSAAEDRPRTAVDWLREVLGIDPDRCPCCGDVLHRETLPSPTDSFRATQAAPPRWAPWDTS